MEELTWKGYARKDGRKGIRNRLLVIYTVECANFVAKQIAQRAQHIDVECVGFSGCTDNEYAVRMLISLIRHPNVGGVLCVGLGCEYVQPERLAKVAREAGKEADWFFIQEVGGTEASITKGILSVQNMLEVMQNVPRVDMRFKDLIIGAECGGSDYTSGLAGNVVVGRLYDDLVQAGGTAIFEEIVEAIGLVELLTNRAATKKAKEELQITYDKALEYCKSVRQYSVSPGNFAGGLSTIEEKSMGAVIKSGSEPIQGVLKVSEVPRREGLWLLDSTPDPYWMQFGITNPNDNEGLMALLSTGCHLLFLITGRGNVVGSAVSPVIKITGNSDTYAHMEEDMDFDAGRVLNGLCTQSELCEDLKKMVIDVASGKMTKSEKLGHKEYFIPYKYQQKGVIKRCDIE
ncbi:D-galactarate dehydratase [Sporanaerobium hydrogeniformans]|uniref:D-galactarate dehydratase n=1 Tax=Sporanaerobium hydrogeniformans TaxID=3072179 RepID=A0AC61DBK1_9FIRM|nr:UxaA family hydrolase [Sporanaerobium hydrogeniformans]PHV70103.1 D-galactarate dehydratase [Sporanaerobium hydrogeniformans]